MAHSTLIILVKQFKLLEAFDFDLAYETLSNLKRGIPVEIPVFDANDCNRSLYHLTEDPKL